ncbi:uncharacterized protein LOC128983203 isoform X2 [Macrosteles quadrilineatus]|uniref:uncharacterized protein LOC128983203 isoform X2 n=1 Tax=Macrosteles quadrilineatus TaxID=74068 RepID=UPI0023E2F0F9|nr:uncharacterized protein LOC128983203 isoform X2 [Macrosteles quadrilineatus]
MSSSKSVKVDTATQVEYNFVEARRIVGEEDSKVKNLSNSLSSLSLRKQNKGIRPPLVGQASSSSNDSVSLSFDSRTSASTQDRPFMSPTQIGADSKQTNNLPNRNDYINQKPPEGSYSNIHSSFPPNDGNQDLTRVRSSSSASSVTSSRPLEWDNGADVGYSQCHIISGQISDSNMSTVERMALVRSTKLLRRSDPEGTTGGTTQQVGPINPTLLPKMRVKSFGIPNAESTPLGTCLKSNDNPDMVEFISPIPYEKSPDPEVEVYSSESEVCGQTLLRPSKDVCSENQPNSLEKHKIPLFPELKNSTADNYKEIRKVETLDMYGLICLQSNKINNRRIDNIAEEYPSKIDLGLFNNGLNTKQGNPDCLDMGKKKLSSSLENICNINNDASLDGNYIVCSLPRSQSQTDFYDDKTSNINISSKGSRGNYLFQNLFKNKSASSSSVATVVQRKGDSPKHATIQTSVLKKQSVGTQVHDGLNEIQSNAFPVNPFCETLHLPKAVLTQYITNKSNYFDIASDHKPSSALVDQCLLVVEKNNKENEYSKSNVGLMTHFHDGIPCKGALKKNKEPKEHASKILQNLIDAPNRDTISPTNVSVPSEIKIHTVGSANLNFQRRITNVGLIDSVESSAKSGGCGTDKQYSVTVEDRVNSFEYLPGHVYENNERHQPINSCGTSSMSIENNTSNNATPEDQNKNWESSGGSILSTFDRDAQRGVDILTDFVKETYENDSLLKRKLISRVIDKLISRNKQNYQDLMKNIPWVPPRPSNPVERNALKNPKSKVPCEISSHSEKSGATNTSSECFIPKPLDRNKCVPSFYQENSYKTNENDSSSTNTSNFTPDKVALKVLDRSAKPVKSIDDMKNKDTRKHQFTKPCGSSNKAFRTHNWKEPVTKTEKLIEERRKRQSDSSGSHTSVSQLLDIERENQLFWIRSEIDHLSNLRILLERQEELKRGLKNCKLRQDRCLGTKILKDHNREEIDKISAATSSHQENKKSSIISRSCHPSKLNRWSKDLGARSTSQENDLDGWLSHQYENNVNIKSCLKKKSKNQTQPSHSKDGDKEHVIYDEPPLSSHQREKKNQSSLLDRNPSESTLADCFKKQLTDGVTQANKLKQKNRESGCQCPCQGKCQCCSKATKNTKKQEPVGYYIIFDDPKKNKSQMEGNWFEDSRIFRPMEERKQKPARLQKEGQIKSTNGNEMNKAAIDKMSNITECFSSGSEHSSDESVNERSKSDSESKNQIFKGGAGELQYHLLHNRPSYVSRAEDRRQCIAQMQYLRELSHQKKRQQMSLSQPDPPIKLRRVFSQHKMRQMTEKKYRQLSEVQEKLQDTKKKENYRTNRLMAEVFKKNLQKRVLKGEVNLSNSVFVISSL